MSAVVIPLASHFLAGSILSLVLPIAVVIAILAWYWIVWRRGTQERVERHERLAAGSPEDAASDRR